MYVMFRKRGRRNQEIHEMLYFLHFYHGSSFFLIGVSEMQKKPHWIENAIGNTKFERAKHPLFRLPPISSIFLFLQFFLDVTFSPDVVEHEKCNADHHLNRNDHGY